MVSSSSTTGVAANSSTGGGGAASGSGAAAGAAFARSRQFWGVVSVIGTSWHNYLVFSSDLVCGVVGE